MDGEFLFETLGHPVIRMPLRKKLNVVGRSSDCDVVVRHPTVSRRHAEVRLEESRVSIRDLDSRNGTFLGDDQVSQAKLIPNQIIRFGDVALMLVLPRRADDLESEELTDSKPMRGNLIGDAGIAQTGGQTMTSAHLRVLELLKDGLSEKQIATRLHLSPHTVHNHIRRIYQAFEVHSRAELLAQMFGTGK